MRAVAVAVCLVALFAVALSSKPRVSVKAAKDLLHRAPEGWERISAANPRTFHSLKTTLFDNRIIQD